MTYETPDGKTIFTQQERIELGQAKNQACEMLKIYINKNPFDIEEKKLKKVYLKWVKLFLEWNTELDSEIMETGKEQQQPSSKTPLLEPQQNSQSPSNYPEHPKGKYGERR